MKRGGREGGVARKRKRVKEGGVGKVGLGYLGLECFFLYLSFRFN